MQSVVGSQDDVSYCKIQLLIVVQQLLIADL